MLGLVGAFFRTLFSIIGMAIITYVLIGVFTNTAPPHFPQGQDSIGGDIQTWVQYIISVVGWPLSHIHPVPTFGRWNP